MRLVEKEVMDIDETRILFGMTPIKEPAPEETPEPSIHDPELGPTEMGGPEEMTGDEIRLTRTSNRIMVHSWSLAMIQ